MRARHLLPVLAVLGCFAGHSAAMAGTFTGIVAFGDSLSDAGNDFIASNGTLPASPPYFSGHFSNGPTWVEDLSQSLGLGTLKPSLAGGTDFAYGGATTGIFGSPSGLPIPIPSIGDQVNLFLSSTGGVAPSTDLYTMWIGSNDVIQAVADVIGGASQSAIVTDLGLAAQAEVAALTKLASAPGGAKTFIVPLISDLGKAPAFNTNLAVSSAATFLSTVYNTDLVNDLNALGGSATIHVLDTFSLTDEIVKNPGAFDFTNVTNACYLGTFTGVGPAPCATPNSYLYWDTVHPTEAGHELIAGLAEQAVPEPASVAIFSSALVAMGFLCRRRRKDDTV